MKKKLLVLIIIVTILACGKVKSKNDNFYTIDLTTIYNDRMNSYKIDSDGNALVLFNRVNEIGKLYEVKFPREDIETIQKEIIKINSKKCDSLKGHVFDGTRYSIILENKKGKIFLNGNTCSNYQILDKLVFSIINKVEKINKQEYYQTLKQMSAPVIKL